MIDDEDFYAQQHRYIAAAVRETRPIDLLTVAGTMDRQGRLEDCGGLSYLTDLVAGVYATVNAPDYATRLTELSVLRRLVRAGEAIAKIPAGTEHGERPDPDEALAEAERLMQEVRRRAASRRGQAVLMPEVIAQRWEQHRSHESRTEGWPTGFPDLDKILGGLRDGDLIVLGARPSMGKTQFALTLARRRSVDGVVLLVSLETSREAIADRLIGAEMGLNATRLRGKQYPDDRLGQLEIHTLPNLLIANLYALDSPGATTDTVAAECWRLKSQQGDLRLVVIDYLTLLGDRRQRGTSDNAHVAEMCHRLQTLARSLSCPILLLSQLSREVEHREDKRPSLSDLRDSGAIEQDASVVLLLYRPAYYRKDPKDYVEVIVAKHKDGPIGSAAVNFDLATGRFADWRPEGEEPTPARRPAQQRSLVE